MILTPGAGAGRDNRTLVTLEQKLSPLPCRRLDFPYRTAGKKMPDRPPVAVSFLREQAGAFAAELGVPGDRLLLGGRSYGGRMCSMAVAEGVPAAGLVLLSYPLHPPGKPENLRIAHFPDITVPVLFVSGRADPFGTPDEFEHHVAAIPARVTVTWVNGGHSPTADGLVAELVAEWIAGLPA
ncbi:dienelactone hydrolase [Nakamurella sp. YIM 132087]|uniref:Dienelactone hydrolase n=1 Tax=Nakamurella alba TaxID=2665158 RepID=A0A7K1FMA2_9ACTN|nr:dienelactone hydrolase [Nakamurella alba]